MNFWLGWICGMLVGTLIVVLIFDWRSVVAPFDRLIRRHPAGRRLSLFLFRRR